MVSDVMPSGSGATAPLRALFSDRRLAAMVGLGFSSGIPFLLVYVTQSAWLSEAKVPIGILGLLSEMTLAYKFKFVWAPFLDRYDPPVLGRLLGRRRGWIVLSQIGVALTLAGVAFGDPAHWLGWTIALNGARVRGGHAGRGDRRLAHRSGARRAPGVDVVLGGGRLAGGQSRRQRGRPQALPHAGQLRRDRRQGPRPAGRDLSAGRQSDPPTTQRE